MITDGQYIFGTWPVKGVACKTVNNWEVETSAVWRN